MSYRNFTIGLLVLLAAWLVIGQCSCQSPRQVAQRKLRKALRIDPTVIEELQKDTAIYRKLHIPFERTAPGIERQTNDFDVDSLMREWRKLSETSGNPQPGSKGPEIYLYKDTGATISVLKQPNGKMAVKFNVLPRIIRDTLIYSDTVKVTMPARILKTVSKAPCYTYFWFWGLIAALVVETILFFRIGARRVEDNES